MNTRDLEYFVQTARLGSMTRAAERLYVTQPTLSRSLQNLEQSLGLALFTRHGHSLRLTYAGERYLSYAEKMLDLEKDMNREMTDILQKDVGVLRLGMPHFRCSFFLSKILPAFVRRFPNVRLEVMEDASTQLDEALLNGQLDLAIYNLFETKPELEYTVIKHDRIYLILPKGHPASAHAVMLENGERYLPLRYVSNETFILQSRNQRLGQRVRADLHRLHVDPENKMEVSNIRAGALLAAEGCGIAFLTGDLLANFSGADKVEAFVFDKKDSSCDVVAVHRRGSYRPHYLEEMIEIAKSLA